MLHKIEGVKGTGPARSANGKLASMDSRLAVAVAAITLASAPQTRKTQMLWRELSPAFPHNPDRSPDAPPYGGASSDRVESTARQHGEKTMNKTRRKILATVAKRLSEIMEEIEEVKALTDELSNLRDEIDTACDEEQDAFAALSEGAQANDRGQVMESAISNMVEATSGIDDLISALDDIDVQSIIDALEGAAE
jgi:hypothetical protein